MIPASPGGTAAASRAPGGLSVTRGENSNSRGKPAGDSDAVWEATHYRERAVAAWE